MSTSRPLAPPRTPSSPSPERRPLPPSQAEWDAMTPQRRQQVADALFEEQVEHDSLHATPEGDEHYDAKEDARKTLKDHFARAGQGVYVGAEKAVFYPGEPGFTPDIIAVVGVSIHKRQSWLVAAEGRGVDVIIEVHGSGRWKKDYVDNVEKFARLGVPEYFIFDINQKSLTAYRLSEGQRAYAVIRQSGGRVRSERLGLELGVRRGRLRFFVHGAALPTTDELVQELTEVAEQEQARVEQEQARAEQEQARAERSIAGLRRALLAFVAHRGLTLDEGQQALVGGCEDPALLQRWIERALVAAAAADIFQDG